MKRSLSPGYAGLLWNLSILVQGGLVACVVPTLPVIAVMMVINGVDDPPSWTALRTLQIIQGVVISFAGGALTERYFRRRIDCPLDATRAWVLGFQIATLVVLLGGSAFIAYLHYGNPLADRELGQRMFISVVLLFGTFLPTFMIASRRSWRRYAAPRG